MLQRMRMLAAATMLALCATGVSAQEPPAPATGPAVPTVQAPAPQDTAAPPAPAPTHELTAGDVETFLDGMLPYALKRGDIAGATIAVVKDGQLLFAKGYGFADIEKRKPVIAETTLFRPGSVSKLFTWTAVMQMVEQGKLDLDRDVNEYIDFKIPDKFGAPITLRQIMSHTAGFEEIATDLIIYDPKKLVSIGDYLKKHIPERIYPPGKYVAYSNYATSVAGYAVERASGERFDDYVANHILKPLGMTRSTFVQPLPKEFEADMSVGYKTASDGKPEQFELVQSAPAGALTSTATDMARFMIAHLNGGALGDVRILKPETAKLMHSRNYSLAPDLNGFNLGFYDEDRNGHRIIAHAGDTVPFHSDLHLILDANVGLYLSFNSLGKEGDAGKARTGVFHAFVDRYFPQALPVDPPYDAAKQDAQRFVGSYTSTRRKESAFRILWLLGQANVTAEPNGNIKIDALTDQAGAPKVWRQIAPLRYREVGGRSQVVFVEDKATGKIEYFTTDDFVPVLLFQRTADLEQTSIFGPATLGAIAIFTLAFLIWVGGSILRWKYGASLDVSGRALAMRWLSRIGVVLFLVVAFGWLGLLGAASADDKILFGGTGATIMTALYIAGVASILGGIAIVLNAMQRVTGGPGGILARGGEIILALAAVYGIWAVINYGLISFNTVI